MSEYRITIKRSPARAGMVAHRLGERVGRDPQRGCGGRTRPFEPQQVFRDRPSLVDPADDVAGSIGVYFDAAGTRCQGTIRPGAPGIVYILAKPAGHTADGTAGAEFKFTGLPPSWQVLPVANPELFTMGDPFGDGVVAAWPCQGSPQSPVLLYSVTVLADAEEPDVVFGIVRADFRAHKLEREGVAQEVTAQEMKLLAFFLRNEGALLSRQQILDGVWGADYFGTERTVDNFINRLRTKIERDPREPVHIVTVRGGGYRFSR